MSEPSSAATVNLLDVWARRKGYSRVHLIRVSDDLLIPATFLRADCTLIEGPIVARCGVKMVGHLFRIPDEYLAGWRLKKHTCPTCEYVASARGDDPRGAVA